MRMVCLWAGHKWNTLEEVDVPPNDDLKKIKGVSEETLLKILNGYKIVYQECENCGDRRTLHES